MPIYALLKNSDFDADRAEALADGYELALLALKLKIADRADEVAERLAHVVIAIGRAGESDPARIAHLAFETIGPWLGY